jgi:DNA primase
MGLTQVVATAGTAMTEQQLKIISNLTSDVRLAYDQDQAGQAATERAIPLASKVGINLSVIVISEGKDPDELIKSNPIAWQNAINQPVYALDWLIDSYKSQIDLRQAIGKRKFSDIILPVVAKLTDPVEQDHYISYLSDLIGISKEALVSKSQGTTNRVERLKSTKVERQLPDKELVEHSKNQDQLLAIGLTNLKLRKYLEPITSEMLIGEAAPILIEFLKQNQNFTSNPLSIEPLNKHLDYVKMLMLQYEALYQNLDEIELDYESKRLQDRLVTQYVKQRKDELSIAMQNADAGEVQRLLNQAKDLDSLLRLTREVVNG